MTTSLNSLSAALVAEWTEAEGHPASVAPAIERELREALGDAVAVCVGDSDRGAAAIVQGASAWTLGVVGERRDQTIAALAESCARAGLARLWSAGPARWYLRSGQREREREPWMRAGATVRATHYDLSVNARAMAADARGDGASQLTSAADLDEVAAWLREEFSSAWAAEVRAAFERGAVFAAREGEAWVAVAAHSGHCAAAGTFGPLATRGAARGRGHGARVTIATLADAGRRGFSQVCVPWVDAGVLPFYERVAPVTARVERALCAIELR